jgi:hypothetical protein
MRKTRRLVLSRERLRNLTPDGLGRVLGGEPGDYSLNDLCNSFDCNTLINGTNAFTNTFTNTLTDNLTNTIANTLVNTATNLRNP